MQNVYKTLWLGSANDYEELIHKEEWFVVHMAKEPYYTQLNGKLVDTGPGTEHFNYIETPTRIAFNITDYGDPMLIPAEVFNKGLTVIHQKISENRKVLVHCTFGRSRSASLVMLYLAVYTNIFRSKDFLELEKEFKTVYPNYFPTNGVRGYLMANWEKYMSGEFII